MKSYCNISSRIITSFKSNKQIYELLNPTNLLLKTIINQLTFNASCLLNRQLLLKDQKKKID